MADITRYFTPGEANSLLPTVTSKLGDVVEVVHRARGLAAGAATDPGSVRDQLKDLQSEAEVLLASIQATGVQVKGVEPGLLDFPALRNGQEVYLCWREGEDEVAWWHPMHTGYAGRQRVDPDDLGAWEWCN